MKTLRRNLQILCGLVLACDLALGGWLLSPRAPSETATRMQLTEARAQWVGLKAELAQIRSLRQRIASSRTQMQQLMGAGFPAQTEASSALLTEFSRIGQASQAQVSGAVFTPDKNAQFGLRRVQINLQVAGGYEHAVRFLNGLERSPMFFLINQVSVSGGQAAGVGAPSNQVRLQVRLEVYEQIAAPPAPSPAPPPAAVAAVMGGQGGPS
ncbi:MAG: type 4a pilus biogenesis protein PilO [Terriglobales bacterium]